MIIVYQIENSAFTATVSEHGAELKSLTSKKTGRNYLYDGSASWKRSSPVLFPNIGGLAGEVFSYRGIQYPALPHGFARDMVFAVDMQSSDAISFILESNQETKTFFPFSFSLTISYSLNENGISVTWIVKNLDAETMYFSIGAHPGFSLLPGTELKDYTLRFDKAAKIETRRVIGRYLTRDKESIAGTCNVLPLSKFLLEKDAIILEDSGIQRIAMLSERAKYHLWIEFPFFPVVAIWTDPHIIANAKFLCIEPWCGINALCDDPVEDISRKSRINSVHSGEIFERTYSIGVEEQI